MREHGGNIFRAAAELGLPLSRMLDFSASINPLGLPESAAEAMMRSVGRVPHYPEPFAESLARSIAEFYNIAPETVICGNGSTELIYLIPRALKPRTVVVTAPTFSEYERACAAARRAKIRKVDLRPEDHFVMDIEAFMRAMDGSDLAFLCNPNNPTGALLKKRDVLQLADAARKVKCLLVVDEAFIDFIPSTSVIRSVRRNPYLVVLRSMTKFYALAGVRMGFGVFPGAIARELRKYKEPWTINSPAEAAALAALQDTAYQAASLEFMRREKHVFEQWLTKARLEYLPSAANYYLVRLKNAPKVIGLLRNRGILVRDCSNFDGLDSSYIRVAVRTREENTILIRELQRTCAD